MLNLKDFGIEYDEQGVSSSILEGVNVQFKRGSINVITGTSGSGKSSLINAINGIIPEIYEAKLTGIMELDGTDLLEQSITERSENISTVFQNPKNQFYAINSLDEIAFALENRNIPREEIFEKIHSYGNLLSTETLLDRDLLKLSGGEKQLVAITSVCVLENDVYLFDEPSASLDHHSIQRLKEVLQILKEQGKIVIIAEHRLFYLREILDTLSVIEEKHLITYEKEEVNEELISSHSLRTMREITLEELKKEKFSVKHLFDREFAPEKKLLCLDFSCTYKGKRPLFDFQISFEPGIYFILGKNGVGKTSFLRNLCHLNRGQTVSVFYEGKPIKNPGDSISLVMQDVNYQLFTDSVESEISIVTEDEEVKRKCLGKLGLYEKRERHPHSLSGGEKQRLALALALASPKKIVILDEPTSGLCLINMKKLVGVLQEMKEQGKTILIVTHDYEFIQMTNENILEFINDNV